MTEAKSPIPVTIFIPPPAEYPYPASKTVQHTEPKAFIPGNVCVEPPGRVRFTTVNTPVIGDVKLTLDDLKSHLLNYFTKLYHPEGVNIADRLKALRQYHYYSPFPLDRSQEALFSGILSHERDKTSEGLLHVPLTDLTTDASHESLPNDALRLTRTNLPLGKAADSLTLKHEQTIAPDCPPCPPPPSLFIDDYLPGSKYLTHNFPSPTTHMNFLGSLSPENEPQEHPYLTVPQTIRAPWMLTPSGNVPQQFGEVLQDVKHQADNATRKLFGLQEHLFRETDDPSLTAFGYTTYPKCKRRPRFGTQNEMETHMIKLYGDLYSQVQWNERRIRALRHRLHTLQMNTIATLALTRNDPRNAL